MQVNGQDAQPGCYVDGHRGQYGIDYLVDVCQDFGIEVPDVDNPVLWRATADAESVEDSYGPDGNRWTRDNAWEQHVGSADTLEELLNDRTTGGYWTWEDGEFFLVQTEVDRWLYVTDTDYDAAWEQVVNADVNEHAGYTDQYQACELAEDAADGEKVYQFRITVQYEPFNHEGQEVTNGNDD